MSEIGQENRREDVFMENNEMTNAAQSTPPENQPRNANMKPCRSCGNLIAKNAKACPSCGAKNKKPIFKRVWFWILVLIVLGIIISAVSGGSSDESKNGKKIGENAPVSTEAAKTVFKIGDIVELDGASVVVNKVSKVNGDDWNHPKNGHEYVIVEVTIRNESTSSISYNPFDFKMQNSQGVITDQTFWTSDRNTDLDSGELAPGGSITGTIPFEEPIGDPELTLIYEGNFWSNSQIRIELQ